MQRYIAFLRAINVGGHTVKMDQLRALFEALDLARVETFIASGNVIFEAPATDVPALERQIERHLQTALGYPVATFIRSTAELAAETYPLYVAFLPSAPASAAEQKLLAYRTAIDDFHIHEREVYWQYRTKMSDSTFSGALLEKAIGMPATMRNITTVRKLAAKYPAVE